MIFLVLTIIFIAALTRSTFGFGDALIAMPLLTMVIGTQTATPLVAFGSLTIVLPILVANWRKVDMRASWRLIVASLLGIPVGLLLLKHMPEHGVKAVLGIVLVAFGLYNLTRPQLPLLQWTPLAFVFGFIAGVLGGAYNTNGPPVIIYGTLCRWPPERFRATLQSYFFPTGFLITLGHGLAGLWTLEVLQWYGYAFPVIVVAMVLGSKLNRIIPPGRFEHLIYAFLVVIGIVLVY